MENDAFCQITDGLPDVIKSQYLKIWTEYQEDTSPESRLVHQMDKLEMALQARSYQNDGYDPERLESFFESAKAGITNPRLKEIFAEIVGGS